jgi:NADH-quinone oxidoreductase subunit L
MRNMGGLKQYLPVTFWLMWIATLAIAGIPPFAGFFSKDEILGAVFLHAQQSTLADASWLGIPGRGILYFAYVLGLVAAFMTATYMTRMMLYTFHGPNRTGEEERKYLHEAPWVMTGPLVVLGILSLVGGWLNLPELLAWGPVSGLEHWLEPVVGQAALRVSGGHAIEAAASTEYMLIGAAVVIAISGIALAWMRLKPASLVPKKDAQPAHGFERVLENKYYVDEAYDAAIVRPTVGVSRLLLWRGIDAGVIDGLFVSGTAALARFAGWVGSQLQTGVVGTYAWVLVIGVLAVLGAFTMR